jgi:hypothetical protein
MQDFTTIIKHGSTWATYTVKQQSNFNYQATLIGCKGGADDDIPGNLTIEKSKIVNAAANTESTIENKLAQAIQYTESDGEDIFS